MSKSRNRIAGALAGIAVGAISLGPSASAWQPTCYTTSSSVACACSNCVYLVFCNLKISAPPVLEAAFCMGNNPGFVVPICTTATAGLSTTALSTALGCGTATLTGTCCGGARTTVADWSTYMTCRATGAACNVAATAAGG